MRPVKYSSLLTEQGHPGTRTIDRLSPLAALTLINKEDARVAGAVKKELPRMANAVALIVSAFRNKGRLFLLGAGTSGRLGVLEAAECPPTFNTPPSLVQAFMAGGRSSVFRSKEGAEDQSQDAARLVKRKVRQNDVVLGIAASGVTAYVQAGLQAARRKKAATIFLTCHQNPPSHVADVVIAVKTGPEVIAGSTRLKAATATKMVLNALTVATMAQMGKIYGNRMVDLQPRSKKLQARAQGLIQLLGHVSPARAKHLLVAAGGNAKTAIVMARLGVTRAEATRRLRTVDGALTRLLGPLR